MERFETTSEPLADIAHRTLSVLVVEDEAVVARDLQRSLGDMGYEVVATVTSGEEALRASESHRPDVVLMDVRINGDRDGIDTAALLRQRHHVPVIYMTAYADEETVARAAQTGPYGYIVKPFTSREVRSAIEVAWHKHEADAQVARREHWFSTVLRAIGDAVIACDQDQKIEFMNPAAERLTGWPALEAVGRPIGEVALLTGGDDPHMGAVVARAMLGRRVEKMAPSSRLCARNGTTLAVDDVTSAIVHEGASVGAVIVMHDVTQQTNMRERAVITERLVALGTLASGVAHEINNPLTFIIGNAYCLERSLARWAPVLQANGEGEQLDAAREFIAELQVGAERIQRIVADMNLFGRPPSASTAMVDVHTCIEWALRVTAVQSHYRARVETALEPVSKVVASEAELGQVLVNLLLNAVDAIPEGERAQHTIRVATRMEGDDWVIVSVHDTGAGIPAAVLPRIFDPFFTTKQPGQGTGLGLSISHRIVASFGGDMSARSDKDHGTTIEVRLPASPRPRLSRAPLLGSATRGRVLLIDDETSLLRVMSAFLGRDHDVVAAQSGAEALIALEEDARFDVILCDLMMPDMGGKEFLEVVRTRWPTLVPAVVFTTGGAFTPGGSAFLQSVENTCLQKPFDLPALRSLIQRRINSESSRPKPA